MRTLVFVACVLVASPGAAAPVRVVGETMGTTWAVEVARPPETLDPGRLRREVEAVLATIDRAASTWRADSELSRFNDTSATGWVAVSPELAAIVSEALRASRLSGGAFDPTVMPLVELWGFGPRGGARRRPPEERLRAVRVHVGFRHLTARAAPPALRKDEPGIRIDLSAVAKGFAVDRVAERLVGLGARDLLVEIGGELRGVGRNRRGEPWTVAIQRPTGEAGSASAVLRLGEAAVATSGDYRDRFAQGGRRYGHVIDPRSGEPVAHALASVTVVADSATRADALATALLVLGPTAGGELAHRERLAALFIVREGDGFRALPTAGIEPYLAR